MIGTTTSLRPTGIGRYFIAAFLAVWLGGWAFGEVLVATALVTLFGSMAGVSVDWLPTWGSDLRESSGAPFAIAGIVLWLTMWTIGGIAASMHFLRSIAGEDTISLTPDGIELVRRAGPFRRRRTFDRSTIRRLRIRPHDQALVVDSEKGTRELTTFGTPLEREDLASWLNQQLQLPDQVSAALGMPPATWDVRTEGDATHLTKVKPHVRTIRSAIAWIITAAVVTAFVNSLNQETGPSVTLLAIALAIGSGAVLSTLGRREWIVRPGQVIFRRSLATWTSEQAFRNGRLEVTQKTDSDNDRHYTLVVTDGDVRRTVHSQLNDCREVDDLGHWLAARTGFPFEQS